MTNGVPKMLDRLTRMTSFKFQEIDVSKEAKFQETMDTQCIGWTEERDGAYFVLTKDVQTVRVRYTGSTGRSGGRAITFETLCIRVTHHS